MKVLDYDGLEYYNSLIEDIYAPKESPAFTGTPTAPTPTANDSSTKISTTAFVQTQLAAELASYLPIAGGTMTGNISWSNGDTVAKFDSSGKLVFPDGTTMWVNTVTS